MNPKDLARTIDVRDYIAIEAMKGIISSDSPEWYSKPEQAAKKAYEYADALIAESNKK